ncbi:MAG: hypothetical protein O4861_21500 [Trichodesmium sp. St16_bin4-tuft]|nr:hypothetical protein [Trichodesmium sp. St16_bin4-tuft]
MLLSVYIGKKMAGRFEGLSDIEWKLFEDIFSQQPEKRGKGMPHTPRTICTIILFSTY